jgi:ribonuclease HI
VIPLLITTLEKKLKYINQLKNNKMTWLKEWMRVSGRNGIGVEEFLVLLSQNTIERVKADLGVTQHSKPNTCYVFTDGNCKNNGKVSAHGAYGVYFPDKSEWNSVGIVHDATNQKAELTAFAVAFETIQKRCFTDTQTIMVCSDSVYSINCMTKWLRNWEKNGWKTSKGETVKNKDLICRAATAMNSIKESGMNVSFQHVFAHKAAPKDTLSHQHFLWYGNNKVDTMINELLFKNKT